MELTDNKIVGSENGELFHDTAFPSWISTLDEFRYESFNIRDKSIVKYYSIGCL